MYRGLIASLLLVTLMVGTSSAELVGWWKFDESGGGDATDSGSSGTTGTAFGSAVDRVDVDGELFGLGLAVDLAANAEGENYFDLGAADGGLNPGAGPFAIAAWAKVAGPAGGAWGGVNSVFGFGDCCAGGAAGAADRHVFELGIDDSPPRGVFAIDTRGGAGEEAEALPGIGSPVGNWVHVVGVKRADGSGTVYINGGTTGVKDFDDADLGAFSVGTHAASANTQNRVNIGRNPFGAIPKGDRSFNGLIGDVQVYHEALTEAQALQLFNNPGTAIPEPSTFLLSLLAMSAAFGFRRIR